MELEEVKLNQVESERKRQARADLTPLWSLISEQGIRASPTETTLGWSQRGPRVPASLWGSDLGKMRRAPVPGVWQPCYGPAVLAVWPKNCRW